MIKRWDIFSPINENLQKARRILREVNKPETDKNFVKLRSLLNRKTGYLGKFTEWMYKNNVSYTQLENLFNRIKNINLPKQIDEYKTPEEVIDSIIRTDSEAAVNQMIGAIPSRTRDHLKECGSDECDECYGDGEHECGDCHGGGTIECVECDGSGEVWEGENEIECPKCKGETEFPCPKKCDNGQVKCKDCNGGGRNIKDSPWIKFTSFLSLHRDKKDIIIDFLSKKSGRYGDYDDDACERLTEDITKLLNAPSVDKIKELSLKDDNVKFIYDDDKYLIIAVNYKGIKKLGSSYWCIVEDEDTFDSYVTEEKRLQLILYVKGKTPLVDDMSVMGITMDHSRNIEAAHWEDDDECIDDAINLICGGKKYNNRTRVYDKTDPKIIISDKNILNALFTLYGYSKSELAHIEFEMRDLYSSKIDKALSLKSPSGPLEKILSDFSSYCDDECLDSSEIRDKPFLKYFINKLRENGIKIKMNIRDLIDYKLIDICKFDKSWLNINIFSELEDAGYEPSYGNDSDILTVIKFFLSNKYDMSEHLKRNDDYLDLLASNKLLPISQYYKSINWRGDIINNDNIKWIIENDFNFITVNREVSIASINYLDDNGLLLKYKTNLISLINSGKFDKNVSEYIASNIDDGEISTAAAKILIPKSLFKKFRFDVSKLEHLKGFDDFIKY